MSLRYTSIFGGGGGGGGGGVMALVGHHVAVETLSP